MGVLELKVHKKYRYIKIARKLFFWVFILLILVFFISPLFWLISTSLKNYIDAFAMPPKFIFKPTFENYARILGRADFFGFMMNSVTCSLVSTALALILGVPCAYAIAMFKHPNAKSTSFFFLSARIAPPIMALFPLYIIFSRMGILGTKIPIIIMYTIICLPIVVWLMPVYFREIPQEMREAAIIDGCNELNVFARIAIPVVRGSIAATAIYCIILTWNEFLIALVMSSRASQTLPVTITSFMTFQGTEWGPLSAAGTIIMVPMIIFGFFIQKYFARGIVSGSIKG